MQQCQLHDFVQSQLARATEAGTPSNGLALYVGHALHADYGSNWTVILFDAQGQLKAQFALGEHMLELPGHKVVVWKNEELPKETERQGLVAQLAPSRPDLSQATGEFSDDSAKPGSCLLMLKQLWRCMAVTMNKLRRTLPTRLLLLSTLVRSGTSTMVFNMRNWIPTPHLRRLTSVNFLIPAS